MLIFKVTFVFLGTILIILKLQDVVEHLLSFLLMERFKTFTSFCQQEHVCLISVIQEAKNS